MPASGVHLAAQAGNAELQALKIGHRAQLVLEPAAHLVAGGTPRTRHQVERRVGFLPQLKAAALVVPGVHAARIEAERHGGEPLRGRFLARPVVGGGVEHLQGALQHGVEDPERRDQLAGGVHLYLHPPFAHVVNDLGEAHRIALQHVQRRRPARRHAPAIPLLRLHRRRRQHHPRSPQAQVPNQRASLHELPPFDIAVTAPHAIPCVRCIIRLAKNKAAVS